MVLALQYNAAVTPGTTCHIALSTHGDPEWQPRRGQRQCGSNGQSPDGISESLPADNIPEMNPHTFLNAPRSADRWEHRTAISSAPKQTGLDPVYLRLPRMTVCPAAPPVL